MFRRVRLLLLIVCLSSFLIQNSFSESSDSRPHCTRLLISERAVTWIGSFLIAGLATGLFSSPMETESKAKRPNLIPVGTTASHQETAIEFISQKLSQEEKEAIITEVLEKFKQQEKQRKQLARRKAEEKERQEEQQRQEKIRTEQEKKRIEDAIRHQKRLKKAEDLFQRIRATADENSQRELIGKYKDTEFWNMAQVAQILKEIIESSEFSEITKEEALSILLSSFTNSPETIPMIQSLLANPEGGYCFTIFAAIDSYPHLCPPETLQLIDQIAADESRDSGIRDLAQNTVRKVRLHLELEGR